MPFTPRENAPSDQSELDLTEISNWTTDALQARRAINTTAEQESIQKIEGLMKARQAALQATIISDDQAEWTTVVRHAKTALAVLNSMLDLETTCTPVDRDANNLFSLASVKDHIDAYRTALTQTSTRQELSNAKAELTRLSRTLTRELNREEHPGRGLTERIEREKFSQRITKLTHIRTTLIELEPLFAQRLAKASELRNTAKPTTGAARLSVPSTPTSSPASNRTASFSEHKKRALPLSVHVGAPPLENIKARLAKSETLSHGQALEIDQALAALVKANREKFAEIGETRTLSAQEIQARDDYTIEIATARLQVKELERKSTQESQKRKPESPALPAPASKIPTQILLHTRPAPTQAMLPPQYYRYYAQPSQQLQQGAVVVPGFGYFQSGSSALVPGQRPGTNIRPQGMSRGPYG